MAAYVDVRPAGYDVAFRPGTTLAVTLQWPAGSLAGRTFASTLGGVALTVDVDGDTMTIEVTAAQAGAVTEPVEWLLLEGIDGVDEPVMVGTWSPSDRAAAGPPTPVQVTQGAAQVTVTVANAQASVVALATSVDRLERDPAAGVRRFREQLALARTGGVAASMVVVGDSLTEAYEPSKRGYRWADVAARRLAGPQLGLGHYVPAAANTFSSRTAGDWPGDQMPWVYTGTTGGSVAYGVDLHAATIDATGTATISFYGDICTVHYTRTPAAPATVTVTFDGAAVTAISPNGAELAGQAATYGTIGDYGYHTIVLTVGSGGTFTLEGLSWSDNIRYGFGIPFEGVRFLGVGHAGFAVPDFTATTTWAASLLSQGPQCVGIALGVNDVNLAPGAGGTPAEYRAGLAAMMQTVDAAFTAVSATPPDYLLIEMPGLPDAWVEAAWGACEDFGADRASVLDLGRSASFGSDWGTVLAADNDHPNNGGQQWVADRVVDLVDPQSPPAAPDPFRGNVRVDPQDAPLRRLNWPAGLGYGTVAGNNQIQPRVFDYVPQGAAASERRHRVWLDPGSYRVDVMRWRATTATLEVLVRGVSMGTEALTGVDEVGYVTLAGTVTIDTPGWYPAVIRRVGNASDGGLYFGGLLLRRTA